MASPSDRSAWTTADQLETSERLSTAELVQSTKSEHSVLADALQKWSRKHKDKAGQLAKNETTAGVLGQLENIPLVEVHGGGKEETGRPCSEQGETELATPLSMRDGRSKFLNASHGLLGGLLNKRLSPDFLGAISKRQRSPSSPNLPTSAALQRENAPFEGELTREMLSKVSVFLPPKFNGFHQTWREVLRSFPLLLF